MLHTKTTQRIKTTQGIKIEVNKTNKATIQIRYKIEKLQKNTYPISTLPEHLHSTLLSHAKTT